MIRPAAVLASLLVAPLPASAANPPPPKASDTAALIDQASDAASAGKIDRAIDLAGQALTADPRDLRALTLRISLRQHTKDWAGVASDADNALALDPKLVDAQMARGVARFMLRQFGDSVKDFDAVAAARPDQAPHLWQRGIALYYAGRYEDGARQFEQHRTVNPDDVENSAWHFACVARWKSPVEARKVLIPSAGDDRVPMMKVLDLFAGKATADDVLAAANDSAQPARTLSRRLFYAHLYIGLYLDATGDAAKGQEHIALAAEKYPLPDYMHGVAKAHSLLKVKRTKSGEK